MKKISLVIAAAFLFTGLSFAQGGEKKETKKEEKKEHKKEEKKDKKEDKKEDKKPK
jgi:Ni/Co efflux regulator RcnB